MMLVKHGIGIQKRHATLYELDKSSFEAPTEKEIEENILATEVVG